MRHFIQNATRLSVRRDFQNPQNFSNDLGSQGANIVLPEPISSTKAGLSNTAKVALCRHRTDLIFPVCERGRPRLDIEPTLECQKHRVLFCDLMMPWCPSVLILLNSYYQYVARYSPDWLATLRVLVNRAWGRGHLHTQKRSLERCSERLKTGLLQCIRYRN